MKSKREISETTTLPPKKKEENNKKRSCTHHRTQATRRVVVLNLLLSVLSTCIFPFRSFLLAFVSLACPTAPSQRCGAFFHYRSSTNPVINLFPSLISRPSLTMLCVLITKMIGGHRTVRFRIVASCCLYPPKSINHLPLNASRPFLSRVAPARAPQAPAAVPLANRFCLSTASGSAPPPRPAARRPQRSAVPLHSAVRAAGPRPPQPSESATRGRCSPAKFVGLRRQRLQWKMGRRCSTARATRIGRHHHPRRSSGTTLRRLAAGAILGWRRRRRRRGRWCRWRQTTLGVGHPVFLWSWFGV